jgi:heme/copper-type cytochrome/quinol oxidase subunit 3
VNGIDVLFTVVALAILFVAVELYEWKRRDEDRRLARLRQRGRA